MPATYAVVWPRSARSVEVKALSPRLATLEGKTVAFLWDYLFRGDEIWPVLSKALGSRVQGHALHRLGGVRLHPRRRGAHGAGRAAGQAQGAEGRRRHLRHGLLRHLHARRVAGQRHCGGGRCPDLVARAARASSARPRPRRSGSGYPNLAARARCRATSTCRPPDELRANMLGVTRRARDP